MITENYVHKMFGCYNLVKQAMFHYECDELTE